MTTDPAPDAELDEETGGPDAPRASAAHETGRGAEESWRERVNAALIAAVAVALLTLAATMIRMNERDLTFTLSPVETFMQALGIYVLPTTVLMIALITAGVLGAFRGWFFAGIAGFVGGILGGVVGYAQQVLAVGLPLDGEAWGVIFLEFFGNNFPFLAFSTLIAGIAGPIVMRRVRRREIEAEERDRGRVLDDPRRFAEAEEKLAFVRVPAVNLDEAELTHLERVEVDVDLAARQWEAYVELLEEYCWETREVVAADTLADSAFTEDPVVLIDDVAILTRSGAVSRRAELPGVRAAVEEAGFVVDEIEKPATLDGGDVLVVGGTVYVGASSRTNASGIRALREIATGLGYRVVAVPITGALHLRTVATALPDGTVLAWLDAIDEPELFDRVIGVPELLGASVLPLDASTVLVSEAAPETAKLVERLGYTVVRLDISEFEKLEGGLTCLSARAIG